MNHIGRLFQVNIFGESHGSSVGVLIDGVKPGIKLSEDDFVLDLSRRKSGGLGTTPRIEEDKVLIESGVFNSFSVGPSNSNNRASMNAFVVYGSDYDRVSGNNDKLIVYGISAAKYYGTISGTSSSTVGVSAIYKSGSYGVTLKSQDTESKL